MDEIDRRILAVLQRDASLPISAVAERAGISPTPCWRRIQKLEEAGVIRARVALLDPEKVNAAVTVFVAVRTSEHDVDWLEKFSRAVAEIPEVVEVWRMSGDVDYMLRVQVPDIAGYDAVYKRIIGRIRLFDVSSSFAMERLKYTTELPLDYLPLDR